MKPVEFADRLVGPGYPCLIIAEAGVNHNGSMDLAKELIDLAAGAGAEAVKFQAFIAEELVTAQTPKARYQQRTTGTGKGQLTMLKGLELTPDQHAELMDHARANGVLYLCTPYERQSADMLEALNVPAYKVASTDVTNVPFLRHLADKGTPVLLSTGMASMQEVCLAVSTLRSGGLDEKIIALQCTSQYPAPMDQINLRAIAALEKALQCPVGFSDHTPGTGASPWAVAAGACVVEKHFTIDRNMQGPDHRASVEPAELTELVKTVRRVEQAMGDGLKRVMPCEEENKQRMQKSLVLRVALAAGEAIQPEHLTCKRPAGGLPPCEYDHVIGRRLMTDLPADTILQPQHIEGIGS